MVSNACGRAGQHGPYLLVLAVGGGACTIDVTPVHEVNANATLGGGYKSLGRLTAGTLATVTVSPLRTVGMAPGVLEMTAKVEAGAGAGTRAHGALVPSRLRAVPGNASGPGGAWERERQPGVTKYKFTFALVDGSASTSCSGVAGAFVTNGPPSMPRRVALSAVRDLECQRRCPARCDWLQCRPFICG